MQSFDSIYAVALERTGGTAPLTALLPSPRTEVELQQLTPAFCLSNMTRRVFQAGLNRKMIDNRWEAFETVFHRFDIDAVRMMADENLERRIGVLCGIGARSKACAIMHRPFMT